MDWKKLISDLMRGGMTQAEIGREVGRPQSWVSAVSRGLIDSVRWEDGQALLALHKGRCSDKASGAAVVQ